MVKQNELVVNLSRVLLSAACENVCKLKYCEVDDRLQNP